MPFPLSRYASVFCCVLLAATTAAAQPALGRSEADVDETFVAHVEAATEAAVGRYPGRFSDELSEIYAERDELLHERYAEAGYLRDDYWQDWLDGLLARIAAANAPQVSPQQLVLLDRSAVVNAHCFGNDVISVNLGLVARANTEAEVAFVLCHELAHQALGHFDARVTDYVDRLYDRETQKRIKRARKDGLAGLAEFEALAKDIAFDASRHSRYGERAADSLGLVFYRKAGFPAAGPTDAMRVLDEADEPDYDDFLDVRTFFGDAAGPALDAWMAQRFGTVLEDVEKLSAAERDSLRTHPDTDLRLAALEKEVDAPEASATASDASGVVNDGERDLAGFRDRREAAQLEIIAGAFDNDRLDLSLYYALRGIQADSTSAWHRGVAALSLACIGEERRRGRFSTVVPPVGDETRPEYVPLVAILQEIRGRDLYRLAYEYAAAVPTEMATPESDLALVVAARLSPKRAAEAEALLESFRQNFPQHEYLTWVGQDTE